MKALILLLSFAAAPAFASIPCDTFMKCGTYQAQETRDDHSVIREVSFSYVSPSEVRLAFTTIDGNDRKLISEGVLNFHDEGSFYSVKDGETFSTGICQDKTCTMSVRPTQINGQLVAQTVVFRFLPDSVQMLKFAVDAEGKSFPGSVIFTKTK